MRTKTQVVLGTVGTTNAASALNEIETRFINECPQWTQGKGAQAKLIHKEWPQWEVRLTSASRIIASTDWPPWGTMTVKTLAMAAELVLKEHANARYRLSAPEHGYDKPCERRRNSAGETSVRAQAARTLKRIIIECLQGKQP